MTVYPSVEAARINPAVLNSLERNPAVPSHLRHWFYEAHAVYKGNHSYAYKAGYLYALLKLVEETYEAETKASST